MVGSLAGKASSPAGRTLTFSAVTQPKSGTVSLTATGAYTYTRTDPARGNLDSFTYRVTDSEGLTAEATAQVLYGRVRIMPTGDSITEGLETDNGAGTSGPSEALRVGYRKALYDRLTAAGYAVRIRRQPHSWCSHRIALSATTRALPGLPRPGFAVLLVSANPGEPGYVVLLHIGTNDVNGSASTDAAPTAASSNSILSAINDFAANPANPPVRVLLATIIGQKS